MTDATAATAATAAAADSAPETPEAADQAAPSKKAKAHVESEGGDVEPEVDPAQARIERLCELIRAALRDSPVSRSDAAWNHLQAQLPGIAAAIVKEL